MTMLNPSSWDGRQGIVPVSLVRLIVLLSLAWTLLPDGACNAGRVSLHGMAWDAGRTAGDGGAQDGQSLPDDAMVDAGPACRNASDCDDSDPCTTDLCEQGHCRNVGLDCDDHDGCTLDSCDDQGRCRHEPACDANATCLDDACQCNEGYEGDGTTCSDIDECARGTAACDPNATCENTEGGYECHCNLGYLGDGFTCTETNCPDGTCSDEEDTQTCPEDCDYDLVVVTPPTLATALASELTQYQQDAQAQGKRVLLQTWSSGDAAALKVSLWSWVNRYDLEGAWLIGDLPTAWYEQTAFDAHEEFPCDVFLESRDATWTDDDSDGRYDGHGDLHADIFVSRLIASDQAQYQAYFAKNHDYRINGSLTRKAAFLFFDDDWSNWAGNYGLEELYATVDVVSSPDETTRAAYIDEMTGQGAQFVYQWIHSTPTTLYVRGTGGGTITASDIASVNLQGSFYNLYDCSASRFTTHCIASAYLTGTDYGLATVGTTKVGGMYSSNSFHSDLANGATWGEAFRRWYEAQGRYDDEWFLGMVILGDPLLTIDKDPSLPGPPSAQAPPWPSARQMDQLRRIMEREARYQPLESFEDYQADHPDFSPRR